MKLPKLVLIALAACVLPGLMYVNAQQGPASSGSETVAKPRKKAPGEAAEPEEAPKIPSRFPKQGTKELPTGSPLLVG